jgi:hypothetical protein
MSLSPNNQTQQTPQLSQEPLVNSWSHPFTPPTCHQWTLWAATDAGVETHHLMFGVSFIVGVLLQAAIPPR